MRLFEFADAKASLELWKIVSDSVWKAISVQAQVAFPQFCRYPSQRNLTSIELLGPAMAY